MRSPRAAHASRLVVFGILLAGLVSSTAVFFRAHGEGDEVVYFGLVHRIDEGRSYSLAGSELIGEDFPAAQYGQPLFYHPPGGIVLFWMLWKPLGVRGIALVQLLAFATFFLCVTALARRLIEPVDPVAEIAVAIAAAFTPILAHVTAHYWVDGPMLAAVSIATLLWIRAIDADSMRGAALAGLALGAASWIKAPALIAFPPLLLLAFVRRPSLARVLQLGLVLGGVAALVHAPWVLWQWSVFGTPFHRWNGRPVAELVNSNPYVHYVTIERSPWIYAFGLPVVLWTLAPSLLATLAFVRTSPRVRVAAGLIGWIAFIVLVHVALGAIGYSKVMRYVILATLGSVLLFGVAVAAVREALRDSRRRVFAPIALVLLVAGLGFEVAQGVITGWWQDDLIAPIVFRTVLLPK